MSSDTIIKLVRWRVRDLAACFNTCKIPRIDEEPNPSTSTDHDRMTTKTTLFDPIGEHRRMQKNEQKLRRKKNNQKKVYVDSSKQITRKSEEGLSGLSSGSCFKEEEYIVFCCQDDGTIDLVEEERTSEASNSTSKEDIQTRRENAKNACRQSYVDADEHTDEKEIFATNGQAEEGGSNEVELVCPPDDIKEISYIESHDDQAKSLSSMLLIADSSDSNRSDTSSGSFAFPELRWEWMGSPVHMPQPEDREMRAQRARGVRLHCFRF